LDIRVSDEKKMACIKKTGQGRIWFDRGLSSGSSRGVVIDRQGRVIAMHTEPFSDVKTVKQIQEARSGNNLEKDLNKKIDDISEAHDSSANSYFLSQYCILLFPVKLFRNILISSSCFYHFTLPVCDFELIIIFNY
jgi:hypothetical protein